nr:hypothetical protein [Tanacetum cinerariifolium]
MADVLKSFPLVYKDRLLDLFNQEVGEDIARVREYRGVVYGLKLSVKRKEEYIAELKALGRYEGAVKTMRFMKGLQQDDLERHDRLLLLMREMEVKAREKSRLSGYQWEDMFILYCRRAIAEDSRLAREIHGLHDGLTALIEESELFLALVLWSFSRSVFDFLAGTVEIIVCATSSMREITEDLRLSREINALCVRVTDIVDERERFVNELDQLGGRLVPERMVEFIKEVQGKDMSNRLKMQILSREFELRAREKDISFRS